MSQPSLAGKVALITGGARRVGAAICRRLHAEGMSLAVHYRSSKDDAHGLKVELETARPDSVLLIHADLHDAAALAGHVDSVVERYGRLDALINNASSFYPTPIAEASLRQWDDLLGTNLKAPFFLSQAAAPYLRASQGCIINIADVHGERPLKAYPIYSAAKAGLIMLTKSLARELAPEVRSNAISPGTILWPEHELDEDIKQQILERVPQKRSGSPEDIAATVLFLIRDAGYINGQVISVCGGRSVVA